MTAHLVLNDLRRFRWPLAGWCALIAANTWMLLLEPAAVGNAISLKRLDSTLTLLGITIFIATAALAAIVVQSDTTIGTDAFWLTRPIAPLRLLGAKALLLTAAIVVLPGAIEALVMAVSGMPAAAIGMVALESAGSGLCWLAVLMAGAVLTRNLGGLVLMWVSVVVAGVSASIVTTMLLAGHEQDGGLAGLSFGPPAGITGRAVWIAGLTLAGTLVLLVQYRSRRRLLATATGLGGVTIVFLAATFWPPRFLEPPDQRPEWSARLDAGRLVAASPVARVDDHGHLSMALRMSGVPDGWSARTQLLDATLVADGRTMYSKNGHYASPTAFEGSDEYPASAVLRRLFSVTRLSGYGSDFNADLPVFYREDAKAPIPPSGGSYDARFMVELTRLEPVGAAPARPGAAVQDGAYRIRIDEISSLNGNVYVRATQSWAQTVLARQPSFYYNLYAVNDRRSEAVLVSIGTRHESDDSMLVFSAHLPLLGSGFSRVGMATLDQSDGSTPAIRLDDAWLADAHLVLIRVTPNGSITRAIAIPNLTICKQPAPGC